MKLIDGIIDLLANIGDTRFKMLQANNKVVNKLGGILNSDTVHKSEDLIEKTITLMGQFDKILDDYIAENNISIKKEED